MHPSNSLAIIMFLSNDYTKPRFQLALRHPLKVVLSFWTTVKTHLICHFGRHSNTNNTDISILTVTQNYFSLELPPEIGFLI